MFLFRAELYFRVNLKEPSLPRREANEGS